MVPLHGNSSSTYPHSLPPSPPSVLIEMSLMGEVSSSPPYLNSVPLILLKADTPALLLVSIALSI